MIKTKWEQSFFSHENGLKFSKMMGIFPEMDISQKKVFTFYAG